VSKRRKSREHVLKILYSRDITKEKINDVLKCYWEGKETDPLVKDFSIQLTEGIINEIKKIDGYIEKVSENWAIERMSVIDRNILRIAVHELIFMDDIPPKVTINEAIEIAKKFGTGDSSDFVNGILDKIKNELERVN